MKYYKTYAIQIILSFSIIFLSSCAELWPDRDIHGECGKATGIAMGTTVGTPLSIAFAPITIPFLFIIGQQHNHGAIGLVILPAIGTAYGFYYVGTTCAYPVYLCALPFRGNDFSKMTDKEKVKTVIEQMPYISAEDYKVLLKASHRQLAPNYQDIFTEPYHQYGNITYGRMAHSISYSSADEWKSWLKAGAPTGIAEKRFTVKYLYTNMHCGDFRSVRIICQELGIKFDDIDEFCKSKGLKLDGDEAKLRYWVTENGGIDLMVQYGI